MFSFEIVLRVVRVSAAKPPKKMLFVTLANDQEFSVELAAYDEKSFKKLEPAAKTGNVGWDFWNLILFSDN